MFAERLVSPAVVADDGVPDGTLVVQPGEERRRVPIPIRCLPLAIRPENLGFVVFDLEVDQDTFFVKYGAKDT
jgi:hypothetical protein